MGEKIGSHTASRTQRIASVGLYEEQGVAQIGAGGQGQTADALIKLVHVLYYS